MLPFPLFHDADEPPGRSPAGQRRPRWVRLTRLAGMAVEQARKGLPVELAAASAHLPVTLEPLPRDEVIGDEFEPDLLGLFVGESHAEVGGTAYPLPAQIFLFLDNLWDYAGARDAVFMVEVRRTYLHELGHYLGFDEDDLAARGLD